MYDLIIPRNSSDGCTSFSKKKFFFQAILFPSRLRPGKGIASIGGRLCIYLAPYSYIEIIFSINNISKEI